MKTVVHITRIRPVHRSVGLRHRPLGSPRDRMLRPLTLVFVLLSLAAMSVLSLLSGTGDALWQPGSGGSASPTKAVAPAGNSR